MGGEGRGEGGGRGVKICWDMGDNLKEAGRRARREEGAEDGETYGSQSEG